MDHKKHLHTPGPWELNEGMIELEGNTLRAIAMVRGWGWLQKLPNGYEIQCANGKLIAAAPDLLEALEAIIEFNRQQAHDQYGDREKAEGWACVKVAREAIKKATS